MPFEERFRFDDHERATPVKERSQTDHGEPEDRGCPPRFGLALLEERELLSEEQILRNQGDPGANEQTQEGQQVYILQELACRIEFLRTTTVKN